MRASSKKIAAISAFTTCMIALAYIVCYTFYLWWFFTSDELITLDITIPIMALPVMFVMLWIYLIFKRKHHMF